MSSSLEITEVSLSESGTCMIGADAVLDVVMGRFEMMRVDGRFFFEFFHIARATLRTSELMRLEESNISRLVSPVVVLS